MDEEEYIRIYMRADNRRNVGLELGGGGGLINDSNNYTGLSTRSEDEYTGGCQCSSYSPNPHVKGHVGLTWSGRWHYPLPPSYMSPSPNSLSLSLSLSLLGTMGVAGIPETQRIPRRLNLPTEGLRKRVLGGKKQGVKRKG